MNVDSTSGWKSLHVILFLRMFEDRCWGALSPGCNNQLYLHQSSYDYAQETLRMHLPTLSLKEDLGRSLDPYLRCQPIAAVFLLGRIRLWPGCPGSRRWMTEEGGALKA